MDRIVPRSSPSNTLRLLAATLATLAFGAFSCQRPTTGPATQTRHDAAVDTARAFLPLREIKPVPQFPVQSAAVEPVKLTEAAARHLSAGRRHFDDQHWTQAIASLTQVLEAAPNCTEARLLLARAALRQGNNALAESHLREVLRTAPRDVAAHQMLGEIAWQEGRADEALASLRLALLASEDSPRRPERVLAHLTLAMALRKEGYLAAAAEQLERYQSLSTEPTPEMTSCRELGEVLVLYRDKALALIAEIRSQLGQHDLAARAYEQALLQSPDDTSLRQRFAEALAQAGRAEEAIAQARQLIADSPDDAVGIDWLRQICEWLNQPARFDEELPRLADTAARPALRFKIAETLIRRGKIDTALGILTRLVDDEPGNVNARSLLAQLRLKRGEAREALQTLVSLLADHPDSYESVEKLLAGVATPTRDDLHRLLDPPSAAPARRGASHYLRAVLARAAGDHEEARKHFDAAGRAEPPFPPALAAAARDEYDARRFEKALETIERAMKLGLNDAALHLLKGRCHLALNKTDEAETALLESFRRNTANAEPLFLLAESYERRGEMQRVEQLYRRIVDDVDPRHLAARERLVRLYVNAEKLDRAKDYFSDYERLGLTGAAVDRCAAMLHLAGSRKVSGNERLEDYRAELRAIVDKYPNDPATYIDLAMTHVTMGEIEEALAQAQAAVKVAPDDVRARELLATLLGRMLDFEKAAEIIRGLLKDRPREFSYEQKLLELAVNRADWDTVIERLRLLLAREDLEAMHERFKRQLVETLILADRHDEAIREARAWLDEAPADESRRETLLTVYQAAMRQDDAIDVTARWLAEEPSNTEARARYVNQLAAADRLDEAQQQVLTWLSHAADDLALNRLLISLFWRARDWDSAIEIAQAGAELSENRVHYQNALGMTYRLAKRHDDAVAFYRARIRNAPGEAAYDDLIAVLTAAERYDEAEATLMTLLGPQLARKEAGETYDPMIVLRLRRHLANVYQLMDRMPAAIEQLERIHELTPNEPGINNDLGYTYLEAGQNLDKAERMIRRAVGERPRESAYLDSYGWVLYKRGRFREAIVYIDRAIRFDESADPVLHDHLADALYRDGRHDEAKVHWEKSLAALDKRSETLETPQDRKLRGDVRDKLRQLEENVEVRVAPLAANDATTRAATDEASKKTER